MNALEVKLFQTQYDFLTAEEPVVCWIGGVGTGKSWAMAWWVLSECMKYPGNIGMLAAATNPQLRMATIPTFKEVFALAGVDYEFSEWRGVFEFANGSWFKAQSLDIPAAELKGSTLGFLAVDEVDACPKEHIEKLIARLRRQNASRRCRMTGNSPPPGHFLEQWYGPTAVRKRGRLLQSSTYENHLLPKDYIEKLETQYPPGTVEYRRYVLGEIGVPLEGIVYREFDKHHIVKATDVPWNRVIGYINALDLGNNHYTVFLRAAVTDDDRIYVYGEHAARVMLLEDHAREIHKLLDSDPANVASKPQYDPVGPVWADHDAQDRMELAALGIDTIPAVKDDKAMGIDAVRHRLRHNTLFFVEGATPQLLGELPNYVWSDTKDEPVKKKDDACFTGDLEVLTPNGWSRLDELDPASKIAFVTADGVMGWEVPSRMVRKKYTGGMHSVNHTNLSFVATDDHKHAVVSQMDHKVLGVYRLSKKTVDELPSESYWAAAPKYYPEGSGVFRSADEAWIAGLWLAEGCFDSQRPTFVLFDQKKPAVVAVIRQRLLRMGVVWSETVSDKSGTIRFCISGARDLADRLYKDFGSMSYGKMVKPSTVMDMTTVERAEFFDGYMAGDGCRTQPGWHFDSVSKRLVDGIQVLASALGYRSVVRTWDCMAPRAAKVNGREVTCLRSWRGSVQRKKPFTHLRSNRIVRFHAENVDVFCPTVSTGMFWARCNGKTFVAGNCDCLRYLIGGYDIESPEVHF